MSSQVDPCIFLEWSIAHATMLAFSKPLRMSRKRCVVPAARGPFWSSSHASRRTPQSVWRTRNSSTPRPQAKRDCQSQWTRSVVRAGSLQRAGGILTITIRGHAAMLWHSCARFPRVKVSAEPRALEWPTRARPAEELTEATTRLRDPPIVGTVVRAPPPPRRARSLSPRMPVRRMQDSDVSWVSASTDSMASSSSDAPSRAHTQPDLVPRVSPRSTCSTTPPPASPRAAHHSWHAGPLDEMEQEQEVPRGTKHWLVTRVARHFSLPFRKDARSDTAGRSTDNLLRSEEKRARKLSQRGSWRLAALCQRIKASGARAASRVP